VIGPLPTDWFAAVKNGVIGKSKAKRAQIIHRTSGVIQIRFA